MICGPVWERLTALLKPCLVCEPFCFQPSRAASRRHKQKVTNSSKMKNEDAEGKYLASLERNTTNHKGERAFQSSDKDFILAQCHVTCRRVYAEQEEAAAYQSLPCLLYLYASPPLFLLHPSIQGQEAPDVYLSD